MAKRDGDDNLSPEMQAKMQAAKKLQDELNAKLSQFGQIASNKNMSSVKEYDDLEKELLELKKYAASVKNENDAKLNDMINAMNKKMEKMAKTALEEQEEVLIRTVDVLKEIRGTIYKLCLKVEALELADDMKKVIKDASLNFLATVEKRNQELDLYLREMKEMMVERKENNLSKCTKSSLQTKIANILHKIEYAYEMKRNQESDQVTTDAI
ncbi:uncharacterized protein LOC106670106 isoform X8 [Cimex lectularius]|uniref:Uncharacterized protein n=1 Tax=Cimex lectularius TaxID=79782 RepID=A0A8I6S4H8_CIMLE|nr:uncharacterized protein LOC106670106 isoform X8 [Cimex lectularius]